MKDFDDLSGKSFGIWEVLEFDHMEYHGVNHKHGMSYYKCKCKKCGKIFMLARSHLTQEKNKCHRGACSNGVI